MKRAARIIGVIILGQVSCSDPVPDAELSALPPENPNIPIGEFHRAGQPCVLCHAPGGSASSSPFVLAGTVFAQPQNEVGVDEATVAFTDTLGSSFVTQTNCVGNFYVWAPGYGDGGATWNPAFPIFARVFKGGLAVTMQGQIGRQRSCAYCHNDPDPTSEAIYSSAGHLHLYESTDTPPPPSNDCPVNPVLQ